MIADELLRHFERVADAPGAVIRLRRFVLDLAIRGKLVNQSPADEPASQLLRRIASEKARLSAVGLIRPPKPVPPPENAPFDAPRSWCWTQLAEIGLISPRNEASDDTMASFVPMSLVAAEYGVSHGHEIRPWGEIKKGYTHFANNDVGLAKITPCFENGKSTVFRGLSNGIGSGTTELHVARPVLVSPDFICLVLKSPYFIENGIPRMTGTAGQKRIPADYFAHSPFPMPPLAEQHRIVSKVDELMALCDRLEAARAEREASRDRLTASSLGRLNAPDPATFHDDARFALDALPSLTARPNQFSPFREALLNLAMLGKLVVQDEGDEQTLLFLTLIGSEVEAFRAEHRLGSIGVDPVENQESPFELPKGWLWVRLASLFKIITDGDHQPPPKSEEGVAFLTIGNVTTGRLDFTGCRVVPRDYFDSLAPYRVPARGDILYTVVGATFGRAALVETEREFCVQRHIAILKPAAEMNPRFLVWLLRSPLVYDQAARSTTGTAQPTIGLRPLRNFLVPLPPKGEQSRLVAKIDELMALCDRLESGLERGGEIRHRLLETLLREARERSPLSLEVA